MWPALIPLITGLLDKVLPDAGAASEAKLKLLAMAQQGELAELDAATRLAFGQTEVNKQEAASSSLFVSGWRPGAGWVCVVGLLYTFLLQPLLAWYAGVHGLALPPVIGTDTLMVLLTGMLGLGGYRSFEKAKGIAS